MDEIDRAAVLADAHLSHALASRQSVRPVTTGPDCLACGEPIPLARREALPGCAWCIDCATEFEACR